MAHQHISAIHVGCYGENIT